MGMAKRLIVADDVVGWTDAERRKFYEKIAPLGVGVKYEALIHRPRMFAWGHNTVMPTTHAVIAQEFAMHEGIQNIFYDAKLFGNPDAIAKAVSGIAGMMGVWAFTFDASMPSKNIAAIVENSGTVRPCGVTVLSSYNDDDSVSAYGELRERVVCHRAWKLWRNKVNLLVCTGRELCAFAERGILKNADAVVTGVRMTGDATRDHAKENVVTPEYAIRHGASYLVVGRPITEAPDPVAKTNQFIEAMEKAAANRGEV